MKLTILPDYTTTIGLGTEKRATLKVLKSPECDNCHAYIVEMSDGTVYVESQLPGEASAARSGVTASLNHRW